MILKILFDQGVPVPLKAKIEGAEVNTVYELGWSTFENGELLKEAESSKFDVLVTTDKNIKYQQNLSNRSISIVVLPTTSWPIIQKHLSQIQVSILSAKPASFDEIEF